MKKFFAQTYLWFLLLLLYGGTLIIEQRRRATEQKIRDLYYGGKIGLLTDLTKL